MAVKSHSQRTLTQKCLGKIFDSIGNVDARWWRTDGVKEAKVIVMKTTKLGLNCTVSVYVEKKIWVWVIVTSSLWRDTEMQPNAQIALFKNMLTSRCPCPHIDKLDFKGASHKGLDGGVVILFGENGDDFSLQL